MYEIKSRSFRIVYLLSLQVLLFTFLFGQNDTATVKTQDSDTIDSTVTRRSSFSGYPYAYYTPETQLAFGAGGIFIFYTEKGKIIQPSKITFSAYYTTNDQYKVSLSPTLYFFRNKIFSELPISFGHYVDKFWGIGNNTPETGNEEYTMDAASLAFIFQFPPFLFNADRSGIILDYNKTEIVDKKNNSLLLDDEVTGSNGGELYGIGVNLVWDNRDHLFFPNKGSYQSFKILVFPNISDFVFYIFELDVRTYTAFSRDHVLATNFYFAEASEGSPFYKLPALGGQNRMRGYFLGRYRDRYYMTFQMEYRQYFWKKFGFVTFAGIGDVANEAVKFSMADLKYSYGVGLRYLFNKEEKVNLRMDIGIGQNGNIGLYFGIEEAF